MFDVIKRPHTGNQRLNADPLQHRSLTRCTDMRFSRSVSALRSCHRPPQFDKCWSWTLCSPHQSPSHRFHHHNIIQTAAFFACWSWPAAGAAICPLTPNGPLQRFRVKVKCVLRLPVIIIQDLLLFDPLVSDRRPVVTKRRHDPLLSLSLLIIIIA